MFDSIDVQEAVRRSIQTEKNARDFYLLGARHMRSERARKGFELLAREEEEHARMFYDIYPGDDLPPFEEMMAEAPDRESDWLTALERELMGELNERRALELAMDKEEKLAGALKDLAGKIADPKVKDVFLKNADSTHQHYELIESEFAHLMGMVHETDIDTFVRE